MTASYSSTRPIADPVGPAIGAMRKRQGKFLAAPTPALGAALDEPAAERFGSYGDMLEGIGRTAAQAARERGSRGLHGHALIRSEVELPVEDAAALLAKDRGLRICAVREVSDADRLCTLERWDMVCASCGRASELDLVGRSQAEFLLVCDVAGADLLCRQELVRESVTEKLCGISRCPVCGYLASSMLRDDSLWGGRRRVKL